MLPGGGRKKDKVPGGVDVKASSLGLTAPDEHGRFVGTELSSSTAILPKAYKKQVVDTQVFNKFSLAKRGKQGAAGGKSEDFLPCVPHRRRRRARGRIAAAAAVVHWCRFALSNIPRVPPPHSHSHRKGIPKQQHTPDTRTRQCTAARTFL
jgi:hypothetical protein